MTGEMNMIVTTSSPGKTSRAGDCCGDPHCGLGLRNHYYDSKRLTPASFCLEQAYGIEHRHLLNRAIHGWGLVYGYAIHPQVAPNSFEAASKFMVSPGLVLDQCGRELYLQEAVALSIEDVMVLDEKGVPIDDPKDRQTALGRQCGDDKCWQLCVHYAEYDVDPVTQQASCNCAHRHWDRVCETVRFSLRRVDCCECCPEPKCELHCRCEHDCCCDPESEARVAPSTRRGGCSCLCEHLTHLEFKACGRLCEVNGPCCRTFRVALKEPVPLACIKIVEYCNQWTFGVDIEECGPRPLVKRNDLLFDLIRGCDLTRIIEIGWWKWHRSHTPVDFDHFSAAFGAGGTQAEEYVTELFWVRFSGPVRKDTVRADCVAMQVLTREKKDGWLEPLRVPIVRLDTSGYECQGHTEWVTGFKFVVGGRWLDDGVNGRDTIFDEEPTQVEIEIRTDFIADCNGQAVDGNPCGLSPAPTGKGVPGGGLLSTFVVAKPQRSTSY
jgi:hypothetical protein